MSLPVVASTPIPVRGATLAGARWEFNLTDLALLVFSVASSGITSPLTKVHVDWGDGEVEVTDPRPIGREFRYTHSYAEAGDYVITVRATNDDGEVSAPNPTPVRVIESRKSVTSPARRWVGLALPNATISATLQSVTTIVPPEMVSISAQALAGANFIVVDGRAELFALNAQVTIIQPGKLITMGRVVYRDLNVVKLDAELNANYDPVLTRVEVRSNGTSLSMARKVNTDIPWNFPTSFDATLVKAAVRMILATATGERVMLPEFGSGLHRIPFEQNDLIVESLVRGATADAIQKWEPRATVDEVKITRQDNDITVSIRLGLSNDPQGAFDINFSLNSQTNVNLP